MNYDDFIKEISAELIRSVNNNYKNNYDIYRFGEPPKNGGKEFSIKKFIIEKLNTAHYSNNTSNYQSANFIRNTDFKYSDFIFLYNILEDQYSKYLLIKLVAYRILGYKKVKLPISTPAYWKNQRLIEANQSKDDFIHINFVNQEFAIN